MTDLTAALGQARDVIQHFTAAVAALTDDDLRAHVRSPSLQPRVSGSSGHRIPYIEDSGLRLDVMRGATDCHHASLALCAIDAVSDPAPWAEPPAPDRRSLPPVTEILLHLEALDAALAEVQAIHLPERDDRDQALTACTIIIDSDALTYQPKHPEDQPAPPRRVRGMWVSLAATAAPTCHLCGQLDTTRVNVAKAGEEPDWVKVPQAVTGRVCAACRSRAQQSGTECRNPLGREECRGVVAHPKLGLCSSCRQAEADAKRGRSPQLVTRLTTTVTTTCEDCGRGCTVPLGTAPRCSDCTMAA